MNLTDAELVVQAQAGQAIAFDELAQRHAQKIFALVFRMVRGRKEVAEDLAQETFLSAFQSLSKFRGESAFSTWLHRIAVNKTLNFLAKTEPTEVAELPESADPQAGPQELIEEQELHTRLLTGVDRLPESLRLVFVMREMQKQSFEEIASALESTPKAIRVRLHRAKKELLGQLRPYLESSELRTASSKDKLHAAS